MAQALRIYILVIAILIREEYLTFLLRNYPFINSEDVLTPGSEYSNILQICEVRGLPLVQP